MKCECGLTFNPHCQRERQRHEERHDEYLRGPVLPEIDLERAVGSISGWPVTECAATDSEGHRANHAKLAKVAQRETSQFPAGYYGTVDEGDFDRRAYAVIKDQRGIALLFSQQVQRSWPAEWRGSEIYLHHDHADVTKMRAIQRVWVAADFRRQGDRHETRVHCAPAPESGSCGHRLGSAFYRCWREALEGTVSGSVSIDDCRCGSAS